MKKIIKFSRAFLPCAIMSLVIILTGVVGYFIKGINYGLEFKPGLMQQVSIKSADGKEISSDEIRNVLTSVKGAEVKETGNGTEGEYSFQIKIESVNTTIDNENKANILRDLYNTYGKENVLLTGTDFIGSQFSSSLIKNVILLVAGTIILIWIYALIRFRWDYACGAIIALIHDALIIMTFIVWTNMEFTTTTIAAILTIIGYSINATVVILDRLRENVHYNAEGKDFITLLDTSLSETLSRSLITTITTMFASISLFIFTTGSIHDFASALTVGLISGCYSSIYISSGFIAFVYKAKQKKINRGLPSKNITAEIPAV